MYEDADQNVPNEHDMQELLHTLQPDGGWTNALGEYITLPEAYHWRQDLIQCENQLKHLSECEAQLDSSRLIQPVAFQSESVWLSPDPLLDTLTTLYTVLMAQFQYNGYGQHYSPSPYAQRFLQAFDSSTYLHQAGFHHSPVLERDQAEQIVEDLNQRLASWYHALKQPDFSYECSRQRRKSRDNAKRLNELIDALFECHSRLLVLRVDLSYTQVDTPYIDYETARYHREQLCRAFANHSLFTYLVGYVWKLEWQPEKGFHYHMLFFFNAQYVQEDVTLAQRIGEFWMHQITGGLGLYYNCNRDAEKHYRNNAMGRIEYHDYAKRQNLKNTAGYLAKIDEYAAMLVSGRAFQTSTLPTLPTGARIGRPRQSPSWLGTKNDPDWDGIGSSI